MQSMFGSGSGAETFIAALTGAVALTVVHQLGQQLFDDAPRMDIVGMRAMVGMRRSAGVRVPDRDTLYRQTLVGDIAGNTLYYSLVGVGDRQGRWWRGAALGAAAGVGALVLPSPMGLGNPPHSESVRNKALTVALYTVGGLAAAGMLGLLRRRTANAERRTPNGERRTANGERRTRPLA